MELLIVPFGYLSKEAIPLLLFIPPNIQNHYTAGYLAEEKVRYAGGTGNWTSWSKFVFECSSLAVQRRKYQVNNYLANPCSVNHRFASAVYQNGEKF